MSLTSYPARFDTLDLTLSSLLAQDVWADHTILWVAEDDEPLLPTSVRSLATQGLSIRTCKDLRSYKKLIPALKHYPDTYIATADDDVFYSKSWLKTLTEQVDPAEKIVICRRAHRLVRNPEGGIAPYATWQPDVRDADAKRPSTDLVPTGVGGILYPPGVFDPIVTDQLLFTRICPDGDDLWFWWMARRAGTRHRQAGGKFRPINWPATQTSALWELNKVGGNDAMIRALEAEFGKI